jgi:hypothetical protein
MIKVKINQGDSYKVGVDEVVGLERVMRHVLKPLLGALNDANSWSGDGWVKFDKAEYKSRDGFIPYAENCGGVLIDGVIPSCGISDFPGIEGNEFEPSSPTLTDDEYQAELESAEGEGHLDSHLRVFFKFEGFDDKGHMKFYLNAAYSNEAPYFRHHKHSVDLFEVEFTASTLVELNAKAPKHVARCIKSILKGN